MYNTHDCPYCDKEINVVKTTGEEWPMDPFKCPHCDRLVEHYHECEYFGEEGGCADGLVKVEDD